MVNKRGLILLAILLCLPLISASEILFEQAGTSYLNITLTNSLLKQISFNVTGSAYNDSYPINITIDILDDGIIDWEYKRNISSNPLSAEEVLGLTSDYASNSDLYLINMTSNIDIYEFTALANLQYSNFTQLEKTSSGYIGLSSIDALAQQILSITTPTRTLHAFIPAITPIEGVIGLYLAEDGSTYYCNSDHNFTFTSQCNLTAAEAIVPEHLARASSDLNFTSTETFGNSKITTALNNYLSSCSLPCNISVKITSDSAGRINFSESEVIYSSSLPEISVTEDLDNYIFNVSASSPPTNVSYFYGTRPNVYVFPVFASDDSPINENETRRLNILNNSLAAAWDNLTNYSHPLNFTFSNPINLTNLNSSYTFSQFLSVFYTDAMPYLNTTYPSIIILVDIKDNFNVSSFSFRYSPSMSYWNLIGLVYLNGFSNNSKTELYRYDEEILLNVALHELAHSFISYPISSAKRFYNDHPASFTDLSDFPTYSVSQSSTSSEGYYEIYSIMNSIRPFVAQEDLGNTPITLSALDKMLLGILSPYASANYTFYSASLSKNANKYVFANVAEENITNISEIYSSYTDNIWWDVRRNSTYINIGANTSFSIPKLSQDNKSLWIFTEYPHAKDHFQVFNAHASSLSSVVQFESIIPPPDLSAPSLTLQRPISKDYKPGPIQFYVVGDENLSSCLFSLNNWLDNYTLSPLDNRTFIYDLIMLSDGDYTLSLSCADTSNNINSTVQRNFSIATPPEISLNRTEWDDTTTNFSNYTKSELQSLSSVTFSNIEGRIYYLDSINLSRTVDLLHKVKVMKHKIWVNSSLIPEFNKSAQLTFRNVTLQNPIVKKDSLDCSECYGNSFDTNALEYSFYTTSFSTYELVEACTDGVQNNGETGLDCGGPCNACTTVINGGGGGGGGGSSSSTSNKSPIILNNDNSNKTVSVTTGSVIKEEESYNKASEDYPLKKGKKSYVEKEFMAPLIFISVSLLAIFIMLNMLLQKIKEYRRLSEAATVNNPEFLVH